MKKPQQKKLKKIPHFKSEDEEREFWSTHDTTDYVDWSKAALNPEFPNLKPSTRTISIRLPQWLINELKSLANQIDIPYQSLVKSWLADKVREERHKTTSSHHSKKSVLEETDRIRKAADQKGLKWDSTAIIRKMRDSLNDLEEGE